MTFIIFVAALESFPKNQCSSMEHSRRIFNTTSVMQMQQMKKYKRLLNLLTLYLSSRALKS